jgi:hypothetical protein
LRVCSQVLAHRALGQSMRKSRAATAAPATLAAITTTIATGTE